MRSGVRLARELAIRSRISLPESAHEWAASATIDAEPVTTAATVLASAIRMFAPNARTTVSALSPSASRVVSGVDAVTRSR
jgi:hypothetical protein